MYSSNPNIIDDEKEIGQNSRSNLSALPRLTKNYTDPAIIRKESIIHILPRSSSSIDLFKSSQLTEIKPKNIKKEEQKLELRPNSSDLETRQKNRFDISIENSSILPRAPISISENTIKKNFFISRTKRPISTDSNSTDDGKIGNISQMYVTNSPVLENNFVTII